MRPMGGLGRHIVGLIPNYLPEIWQHYILPVTAKFAPAADPGWGSLARAVEVVDGVAAEEEVAGCFSASNTKANDNR